MKNHQLEQLLTQLTPQQAANLEGGAIFLLESIRAISPVRNDPRIVFGGQDLFSMNNLDAPNSATIYSTAEFFTPTDLKLYDMEPPDGLAGDVLLGQRTILVENADGYATLGGYRIYYQVTGA
jgi:hypothetical protein